MVDRRFTIPANPGASPNRATNIPRSKDGSVTIPLGRVNEIEGDKYMVFGGDGVTAKSEPVVSAVFIGKKDFVPDANNPNDGFLKLGGVTTDIPFSAIDGPPVVMMLEIKPQQRLDFIPEGARLVSSDGTTQPAIGNYANDSNKPETIILFFPQRTHGYVPGSVREAGDMVQLRRSVAQTNAGELGKIKVQAQQQVEADIRREMLVDITMKKPEKPELEARISAAMDSELERRFEQAEQTVERMRELLGDADASKDFSTLEKRQIRKEIERFEENKEAKAEREKKAQKKNGNAVLAPNTAFDSILASAGFHNPAPGPSPLAQSATGLPDDIKGKLAKNDPGRTTVA
jgi:hypothetical protein